jgi:hypothetical protein
MRGRGKKLPCSLQLPCQLPHAKFLAQSLIQVKGTQVHCVDRVHLEVGGFELARSTAAWPRVLSCLEQSLQSPSADDPSLLFGLPVP